MEFSTWICFRILFYDLVTLNTFWHLSALLFGYCLFFSSSPPPTMSCLILKLCRKTISIFKQGCQLFWNYHFYIEKLHTNGLKFNPLDKLWFQTLRYMCVLWFYLLCLGRCRNAWGSCGGVSSRVGAPAPRCRRTDRHRPGWMQRFSPGRCSRAPASPAEPWCVSLWSHSDDTARDKIYMIRNKKKNK